MGIPCPMAVRVELPLRRLRLVQHPRPALGAVGVGVRGSAWVRSNGFSRSSAEEQRSRGAEDAMRHSALSTQHSALFFSVGQASSRPRSSPSTCKLPPPKAASSSPPSSPSPSSSATGCQPFSLSAFHSFNLSVSHSANPQSAFPNPHSFSSSSPPTSPPSSSSSPAPLPCLWWGMSRSCPPRPPVSIPPRPKPHPAGGRNSHRTRPARGHHPPHALLASRQCAIHPPRIGGGIVRP